MKILLTQICGCRVIDDDENGWMISYCEYHGRKTQENCIHEWTGQQMGGDPAEASSTEWVAYCKLCGEEKPDEDFVREWMALSDLDFIQFWRRDLAAKDAQGIQGIELSVFFNALDRLEKRSSK